jgi:CheY-like chemotaxis protein
MKKHTILLVDDDPDYLESNSLALESDGFIVLTADSVEEALKLSNREHLDAAVLDVIMDKPDSGFALARRIRGREENRNIPIVLLTALNAVNRESGIAYRFSDRDRDEQWLPVDRILNKPIRPDKLVAIMRELIGGA